MSRPFGLHLIVTCEEQAAPTGPPDLARLLPHHQQLEDGRIMTVTGVISAIIIGAIIGALARLILPGRQHIPIWLTILVGVVAALVGTWLARVLGIPPRPRASTGWS